jgi:predicted CoA-binding protein
MSIKEESLQKSNWAVVGATNKEDKYGYKIVKVLQENGYSVFPVNPSYREVAGVKCYAGLRDIPEKIEVVDMVINPQIGVQVMEEVINEGINYVWLQPGARSDDIKQKARENNINFVEDCIYATLS